MEHAAVYMISVENEIERQKVIDLLKVIEEAYRDGFKIKKVRQRKQDLLGQKWIEVDICKPRKPKNKADTMSAPPAGH